MLSASRSHRFCERRASLRMLGYTLGFVILQCAAAFGNGPQGSISRPRGSVYVPMDSWVYSAFDRLAGLGAINTQFAGLRPWTRIECAELVLEAEKNLIEAEVKSSEAAAIDDILKQEFSEEIHVSEGGPAAQAEVESTYTRATEISGRPLRDAFHFGQTVTNDFGRPFNTGFNSVAGFSTEASGGRFFAYLRGEYQHSPAYAGLTATQQAFLKLQNGVVSPYSQAMGTINDFELLDTYVGVRLSVSQ